MEIFLPGPLAGKKILFAAVTADGHFNPLTGLAKYLQGQGAEVRWYASARYADRLRQLAIPHHPFDQVLDVTPENITALFPEKLTFTDPAQHLDLILTQVFAKRSEEYYHDLRRVRETFAFELLVADSLFSGIPFVRAKLGLPVVAIGVLPLAEWSADLGPYGLALPPATTAAERAQYAQVRHGAVEMMLRQSVDAFGEILDRFAIAHARADLFALLIAQASRYLQIGIPSFEYPRPDLGAHIRYVGALHPHPPPARQPWHDERLARYDKVILVTQGTVEKDLRKLLVPTLEAFKDSEYLVIATTGTNQTAALRAQFPHDNLLIEDTIPFDEVMPHAQVFVTNGGYGGVLLGIKHQLPMVAAGIQEVKNEVCARIGHFRLGLDLRTETPTPAQLRQAVTDVLADPGYRANVTRLAAELAGYPAHELCARYIGELLG